MLRLMGVPPSGSPADLLYYNAYATDCGVASSREPLLTARLLPYLTYRNSLTLPTPRTAPTTAAAPPLYHTAASTAHFVDALAAHTATYRWRGLRSSGISCLPAARLPDSRTGSFLGMTVLRYLPVLFGAMPTSSNYRPATTPRHGPLTQPSRRALHTFAPIRAGSSHIQPAPAGRAGRHRCCALQHCH